MSGQLQMSRNYGALIPITVVPRLTMIIRSRKIAVKRKHRKAKLKTPLKCTETRSMHSNEVKTHCLAKILHTAAIFAACIERNPSLNTAGSHFNHPVAILKPPISCSKMLFCEESVPKAGNRSSQSKIPPFRPSLSGFIIMRGNHKARHHCML